MWLVQLLSILSLPVAICHETSHWAIARVATDDAAIAVEVFGGEAIAVWPPLESRLLRVFAFLAPTVCGSILVGIWLVSDVSVDGWRLPFALGLALYTIPSPADVRGALGVQDVQINNTETEANE
jgi:peptidoglycan/LPS O-acetylase OafA/YrhL